MPHLPPIRAMPDVDLLALLLGADAASTLANRRLSDLFALHANIFACLPGNARNSANALKA